MNSQKQMLKEIIELNGYSFTDFSLDSIGIKNSTLKGDRFNYLRTQFYFAVLPHRSEWDSDRFWVQFSPGNQDMTEDRTHQDFDYVCNDLAEYLTYLQREVTSVDPWASVAQYTEIVESIPKATGKKDAGNKNPVEQIELQAIWKALGVIQETLLNHVKTTTKDPSVLKEKLRYVEKQIGILKDSGEKFTRKDYLMLLYSTLIGTAQTVAASPEICIAVVNILSSAVSKISHLGF